MRKFPDQIELENEVVRSLFSAMDKRSLQGKRDSSVLRLMLETGVRIGELINLEIKDLIQQGNDYSIQVKTLKKRKVKNKSEIRTKNTFREIPITSEMVEWLHNYWKLEYRTIFPNEDFPFFKTKATGPFRSGPITLKSIRDLIRRAKIKAGVNIRITPHTMRHTFLSKVAREMDIETARDLGGHESILSTQVYLHSSLKRKREAVEGLNYDF